jgi:hypothetical protein
MLKTAEHIGFVLLALAVLYAELRIGRYRREQEEARIDVMRRALERERS